MSEPNDPALEDDRRRAAALPDLDASPQTVPPIASSGTPCFRLGKYTLCERLGGGGLGDVYSATQDDTHMRVAVKVCRASGPLVERFRREVVIAAGLKHLNVVVVHDAGEHLGQAYLVMELLDGLPLDKIVTRAGSLCVADACEIARQAAVGLDFAHGRGAVHRDVKPANLCVTRDGVVKILDWGLASQVGCPDLTSPNDGGGTPGYAPPEQWADFHNVDVRADLYALGATLREMLGTSELPPNLADLLRRLLAERRNDRPASAREVAHALTPFATGHDVSALVGGPAALDGELRVTWWDAATRCHRGLHEAGALPMARDTHLSLFARLSRPAYAYLVWIDTEGGFHPMHGWRAGTWEPEAAVGAEVRVPTAGETIPLTGPMGTETVVLLATERPLVAGEGPLFGEERVREFRRLLGEMPKDERMVYGFPTVGMGMTRGPGATKQIDDPVELLHEAMRELCARFEVVRAVSFANKGSDATRADGYDAEA